MKRLFVSELDTLLGRKVCDLFAATKEYEITGTVRSDEHAYLLGHKPLPPHVSSITPSYRTGNVAFKKAVLHADTIVCILKDDLIEAEAATKMLRNEHYEVEKTLVVVSSVMTWANTVASKKAEEKAEREAERAARIADGEEVDEEELANPDNEEGEEPVILAESEYQGRVPHHRYQHWKELEVLVKQANSATLHTHVIFAGLHYGLGEEALGDAFRAAWHQQPVPLLTDGSNVVPMIHAHDLAKIIFKTASADEEVGQRYILAVDRANSTLGNVMQAIANQMGSGLTVPFSEARHGASPYAEFFKLDVRLEPSAAFDILPEDEWYAPNGIIASFDHVANEFRRAHNLSPVRAMLLGPPLSGKSHVSALLSQEYKIPHLTVTSIIESYEGYMAQLEKTLASRRAERKRARRQAAHDQAEEEKREAREAARAERENNRREGEDDDEDHADHERGDGEDEGDANNLDHDDDAVSEINFSNNGHHLLPDGSDEAYGADYGEEGGSEGADGGAHFIAAEDEEDDEDDPEDEVTQLLLEQIQRAKEILSLKIREGLKPKSSDEGGEDDEGNEEEEVDEDGNPIEKPLPPSIRLRFVDESLAAMGRWRLQQKDCLNQGYILDGFPKNVRQACFMFGQEDVVLPSLEEIKERETEPLPVMDLGEATARVDGKLLPDACIHLYADDGLLLNRATDNSDVDASNTTSLTSSHTFVGSLVQRLRQYKSNHDPTLLADASLLTWARSATSEEVESNSENGLVPAVPSRQMFYVEVNAGGLLSEEGLTSGLSYLKATLGERHFVCPTAQELKADACEREHQSELLKFKTQRAEEKRKADEQLALERRQREMAVHERRYRSIAEEKKLAEDITSMPMETYLAQFVLQPVAKGVERVIAMRPEDPVRALADFLFDYEPRKKL